MVEQTRTPIQERFQVAIDLASAIDYLHSRKVLHGNLNPETIGFDSNNNLSQTLSALGAAKIVAHKKEPPVYYGSIPIRRFSALAHRRLAPEVDLNNRVGLAADIDALSIILRKIWTLKDRFSNIMIQQGFPRKPTPETRLEFQDLLPAS
jgi:serine/threonine protein kinase